jgi:tyrosinase
LAARSSAESNPVEGTARLIDGPGANQSVKVKLQNAGTVGQLVFDVVRSDHGASTLQLDLPGDGSPIRFWVAGEFQKPGRDFGDAVLQVTDVASSAVLNSTSLMVRIRKDATTLTIAERDRFLNAFGTLNGQGTGRFADFRNMHTGPTLGESHNEWGFLPWHRSYLLDLERQLQSFDSTVTLPYWQWDAFAYGRTRTADLAPSHAMLRFRTRPEAVTTFEPPFGSLEYCPMGIDRSF